MENISPARGAGRAAANDVPPTPNPAYDSTELCDYWCGVFDILGKRDDLGKLQLRAQRATLFAVFKYLDSQGLVLANAHKTKSIRYGCIRFGKYQTAHLESLRVA